MQHAEIDFAVRREIDLQHAEIDFAADRDIFAVRREREQTGMICSEMRVDLQLAEIMPR